MIYSITLHIEVEADDIRAAYRYADAVGDAALETEDTDDGAVLSVTIGDVEEVGDEEV